MAGPQRTLGIGKITRGSLYLLLASSCLSLVFQMGGDDLKVEMSRYLSASGHSVWSEWHLWTLVTSPLLEDQFVALIFQGFMLWMFLPALERWWGMKRFLKFAFYTSVPAVAAGTLVGHLVPGVSNLHAIAGLDPFIYAGIVAYGTLFSQQQVQFFGVIPMTGRQLTIGISAFMLVFVALGQVWEEGAANVTAMLVGWLLTSGKWTPKVWYLKQKQKRIRRHLKVVTADDEKPRRNRGKKGSYLN